MTAATRKALADVLQSPARTLTIVVAMAAGAAAVSMTFGARAILSREIEAGFRSTRPPAATLWLDSAAPALARLVEWTVAFRRPSETKGATCHGFAAAEPRRALWARAEITPGRSVPLRLFLVPDFADLRVARFHLESGAAPRGPNEILVERSALPLLHGARMLRLRLPDGAETAVSVSGVAHDPSLAPGWVEHVAYAYALPALAPSAPLNQLQIALHGNFSRDEAVRAGRSLAGWLAAQGYPVRRVEVPMRVAHPHAGLMSAVLTLLQVFGLLALALSGFLAANVMAAVLARQVRQIGIMKAIGASARQVAAIYARPVAGISILAATLGLPLGAWAARAFAVYMAGQLNLEVASLAIPWPVYALEWIIAACLPAAIACVPILRATRLTVREALLPHPEPLWGRPPAGAGHSGRLPRQLVLALRNSFRRPARLAITLISLGVGGALLITAGNTYAALLTTIREALAGRGDDVEVRLDRPAPIAPLLDRLRSLPGVASAEAWGAVPASLDLGAPVTSDAFTLLAPPESSRQLRLNLIQGRWPAPSEHGAVVVTRGLRAREPALAPGATVQVRAGSRSFRVRVVGVVEELGEPAMYTTRRTFDRALPELAGQAAAVRLLASVGQASDLSTNIQQTLEHAGLFPTLILSRGVWQQTLDDHFLVLLATLLTAAAAAVLVGGLGLGASMTLNVLERAREIGVLRAIGATRHVLLRMLLVEGGLIAALSVVLAVVLSLPLSAVFAMMLGRRGLQVTVPLVVSPWAILAWAAISAAVTLLACWWPAQGALRTPVRDVLAHE